MFKKDINAINVSVHYVNAFKPYDTVRNAKTHFVGGRACYYIHYKRSDEVMLFYNQ